MSQAQPVFIRDPEYAWIPALKTGENATKAQVKVPQYKDEQAISCDGGAGATGWEETEVPLKDYNKGLLPAQNVDGAGNLRSFPDMVKLTFLHEVRSDTDAQNVLQISKQCVLTNFTLSRLAFCTTLRIVTAEDCHTLVLVISSLLSTLSSGLLIFTLSRSVTDTLVSWCGKTLKMEVRILVKKWNPTSTRLPPCVTRV
jgi:hypothetical protein